MRILVTGGCGFIGSQIVKALAEEGHHIIVNDLASANWKKIDNFKGVEKYACDFIDIPIEKIEIDLVFHQAAISDPTHPDPNRIWTNNYVNAVRFLDRCIKKKIRFIYASSSAVYGNTRLPNREFCCERPLNIYGRAKLELDRHAFQRMIGASSQILGLRYFNVYGPGEEMKKDGKSVVGIFIEKMLNKSEPIVYGDGNQRRDFVYIKDIVMANLAAMESEVSGIINIGCGESTSFNKVIQIINQELKTDIKPRYVNVPYEGAYQKETLADLKLAKKMLNFRPFYKIKRGIKDYINYKKSEARE